MVGWPICRSPSPPRRSRARSRQLASWSPPTGRSQPSWGWGRPALGACGFDGRVGQCRGAARCRPDGPGRPGAPSGIGSRSAVSATVVRDAAATFRTRAATPEPGSLCTSQAAVESSARRRPRRRRGRRLGRYHFHVRPRTTPGARRYALMVAADDLAEAEAGARQGRGRRSNLARPRPGQLPRRVSDRDPHRRRSRRRSGRARGCRSRCSTRRRWSSWAAAACSGSTPEASSRRRW